MSIQNLFEIIHKTFFILFQKAYDNTIQWMNTKIVFMNT